MGKFTLRIIHDWESGQLVPDTLHEFGGTDLLQAYAFTHLFPSGQCNWMDRELLYDLARIHGWDVAVTERKAVSS